MAGGEPACRTTRCPPPPRGGSRSTGCATQWPAAVRLLELCSFFAPEPISLRLLYSDEAIRYLLPYDATLQEKLILGRVIRELGRYALAKVDQGRNSIEVHRLVQAVVRESLAHEVFVSTEHDVHRILVSGRPRRRDRRPGELGALPRHLAAPRAVDASECTEEPVRGLLVERVRYMWLRGEYEDGMAFARRLEAFWGSTRGPDDRQLLYLRFHIANILRSQGEYFTALTIDRDVLERQTRAFGPDYVHTLMTRGSLAADLGAVGDLAGSLETARGTYDSFQNLFDEDHPLTLMAANNLALALRLSGDCFEAREMDAKTLSFPPARARRGAPADADVRGQPRAGPPRGGQLPRVREPAAGDRRAVPAAAARTSPRRCGRRAASRSRCASRASTRTRSSSARPRWSSTGSTTGRTTRTRSAAC